MFHFITFKIVEKPFEDLCKEMLDSDYIDYIEENYLDLVCTEPVPSTEPQTTEESGFLTNFLSVGLIVSCTLLKL